MANIPEGAQRSEDGHWWWDGEQWQPVDEAAAAGAEGDERVSARLSAGLPANAEDLTEEQQRRLLGQPTVHTETLEYDEVEVLAMADQHGNGEATA
jgi:hypothetical protein